MGKAVAGATAAMLSVVFGLVLVVMVVVVGQGSTATTGTSSTAQGGPPGSGGVSPGQAIPTAWLTLYQQAAATCPGLPWTVPAAIGTTESDNGRSTSPGVWSGANSAGAEGPMQFEPATFAEYATVGPGGARPPSPYDQVDAIYTAAHMLCANGAGSSATLRAAVFAYNHSDAYVNTVLTVALAMGDDPQVTGTVIAALSYAARQLNTPYVWGGIGNGGFDCSGLAQAAFRTAGIALPRVAQGQFDAGPVVAGGTTVIPGDLLFFGGGPTQVDHVGLYVGAGEMIDAPHTGALVRFDDANWSGLVGATRPGG
jgi:cell wall-associated NlpC family hydrolase